MQTLPVFENMPESFAEIQNKGPKNGGQVISAFFAVRHGLPAGKELMVYYGTPRFHIAVGWASNTDCAERLIQHVGRIIRRRSHTE